jgi:glycosyltransferase involved in cell wall biosynthesis
MCNTYSTGSANIKHQKNKPVLLIVGAFPPPNRKVFGGILTNCALLESNLSGRFSLILLDSTQVGNPHSNVYTRLLSAIRRVLKFIGLFFHNRPDAVLIFTAGELSVLEKGVMSWIVSLTRPTTLVVLFPRAGGLIMKAHSSVFHKIWIKLAMRGSSHVFCQAKTWQKFTIDTLGFKEEQTSIIHNWSATDELLELGANRILSSNSSCTTTVLFLGWVEKNKGIFELLESVRGLYRSFNLRLLVAGYGLASQEAKSYVIEQGMQDCVQFLGWVEGKERQTLLGRSDILILPSWAEGFPNSVIEAMAAKIAIITTTVGVIPDLICNGQEGLLVPPKNVASLRNAIRLLLENPQLRMELAERGYVFTRSNFHTGTNISKLSKTIINLIEKNKSSRQTSC